MRVTTIALPGLLLLLSATTPANSTNSVTGLSQTKAAVELSAATAKKKPKKMKTEKVEYMRSAAPPEPKK